MDNRFRLVYKKIKMDEGDTDEKHYCSFQCVKRTDLNTIPSRALEKGNNKPKRR
jgi:hypothetical protein